MIIEDLTLEVRAVGQLNIAGNVMPVEWLQNLRTDSGRPDLLGAALLADIVYWYRPIVERDETTGQIVRVRKKFKADLLQKSNTALAEKFGVTKKLIREALRRLERAGLIWRELRVVKAGDLVLSNVQFLGICADKIAEITISCRGKGGGISQMGNSPCPNGQEGFPDTAIPPARLGSTYTQTSTETSQKISKTAAEEPPAAVPQNLKFQTPGNQPQLPAAVQAAIAMLPREHRLDAEQVCLEEATEERVKVDALYYFMRRLAAGKASGGGFLRQAIRKGWGAADRETAAAAAEAKAEAARERAARRVAEQEEQEQLVEEARRYALKNAEKLAQLGFGLPC